MLVKLNLSHCLVFIFSTLSVTSYAVGFNDSYIEFGHSRDSAVDLNKGFLVKGSHQFENTVIITGGFHITDNDISYERKFYELGLGKNIPINNKSDVTFKAATHYLSGEYTPPSLSTEKTKSNYLSFGVGLRGLLTNTTRASISYTNQISCGTDMNDKFFTVQAVQDLTKNFHLVAEATELTNNNKTSSVNFLLRHSF